MKECKYYNKLENNAVKCDLCPHNCIIKEDKTGFCNSRKNINGILYSLTYGKPISIAIDPIEKKPLFNFHKGENIISVGTLGCNLKCKFCQNFDISQAKTENFNSIKEFSPQEIISIVKKNNLKLIAFTYNEPTVFFEYCIDIAKLAKENNIECVIVSNGFINTEPLKELCKHISAANIDLKSFEDKFYKELCLGRLNPVLESLKVLKENNIHIEITNLIIPKNNDSKNKINELAMWIKENLGKETPLHLSRFFPMYKMNNLNPTDIETLESAYEVAKEHLDFVYLGNV